MVGLNLLRIDWAMGDFLANHASEIWSFLGGLVGGGIGGSLLTLRITSKTRVSGSGTSVDQRSASADGDIVGRDKTTTTAPRRG